MKTLAIYDSGLGGYSIYHDLKTQMPNLNTILYADQKHAPYGNRSYESLLDVSISAISSIIDEGITDILVACNTISATSLATLKLMFPEVNIIGIIDLTLSQIQSGHIAVLATQATTASKAYETVFAPKGDVTSIALPNLVALIENLASKEELLEYLNSEVKLKDEYDALVLACTHYPLVLDEIQSINQAHIYDSRIPIREAVASLSGQNKGVHIIKTSGDCDVLKKQIKVLFNEDEEVTKWNL